MPSVVFRDIDLNFRAHPITKQLIVSEGEVAVKKAVGYLLQTAYGDRVFQPELGSNMRALLFENVSRSLILDLESAIREVINNYEPRAEITKIIIDPQVDRNGYAVSVEFRVVNQTIPATVNLFLERLR